MDSFSDYIKASKVKFIKWVTAKDWCAEFRTEAEDFIIAYDQLTEEVKNWKNNCEDSEELVQSLQTENDRLRDDFQRAWFWINCTPDDTEASLSVPDEGIKVTDSKADILELLKGKI